MATGGSLAQGLAYLLLDTAAPGLNHGFGVPCSEKIIYVAVLVDSSAMLRGRVDIAKSSMVDQTHPS